MSISAANTNVASDPLAAFRVQKGNSDKVGSKGTTAQTFLYLLHKGESTNESSNTKTPTDIVANQGGSSELRDAFNDFVGQTFYSQMLSTLRKSVQKSEYFDGGRGEEVFQGQLDQVIVEKLSDASAGNFTGPMFDLFAAQAKLQQTQTQPTATTSFTA